MDPMDGKHPLARNESVIKRQLDGELIVYDKAVSKAHCLNDTAARVWAACDGTRSVQAISESLTADLHTKVNEQSVWQALAELQKAELLEQPVVPAELMQQLSRRHA